MTTLVGRIEHRLKLSHHSSEFIKKKRKRDSEDSAPPFINNAGIFFIPSDSLGKKEYLLVVPQSLLKAVCDAARFKRKVKLSCFTVIDLISTTIRSEPNSIPEVALLELGIIEILQHQGPKPRKEASTLTEFRDLETSHESVAHTIVATVDAISPIIAVVPSDPFCLVELYQTSEDGQNTFSCVIVIKGEDALACHAGMLPGDRIMLDSVRRQRWSVPDALWDKGYQHMQVPKRAMVITESTSIVWKETEEGVPTVPTTLSIVQGTVDRIVYTKDGIQRIELIDGGVKFAVFLTHLPMSTNLQYGLRKGALVRAINIHPIPPSDTTGYFGTCLRSTIVIIRAASQVIGGDLIPSTSSVATAILSRDSVIPWRYCRIRSSISRQALLAYVTDNAEVSGTKQEVSHNDLVGALLRLYHRQQDGSSLKDVAVGSDAVVANSKRRDQFAEFLDHGLEVERDDKPEKCGCHMSHFTPDYSVRPMILSISRLKRVSSKVLEDRLIEWIDKMGEKKVQGGSVASIQLRGHDVVRAVDGSVNAEAHCLLCITGKLTSLDASDDVFLLGDSTCCCPITTKEPAPLSDCFAYQHVICNASVCIASALCLGLTSATQELNVGTSDDKHDLEKLLLNLESWTELEQTTKDGSCALLNCNGYAFMISVHIHCETIVPINEHSTVPKSRKERKCHTVEQMLDPHHVIQDDAMFAGFLCRQRLKFAKIKKGQFCGTMLTIAHCSTPSKQRVDASDVSTLQSLELNVSTPIPQERKARMTKNIQSLFSRSGGSLLEEQCSLAAAWWKMADGPSSALIACGVDETLKAEHEAHKSTVSRFVPFVAVPTSALEHGSNGFVRFRCDVSDIQVNLVEVDKIPLPLIDASSSTLTSLGGQQFLRGMLDRLLIGRGSLTGELKALSPPGVQHVTLGDLHTEICADIRLCSQSTLAPSMVRLIRGARFLAVAYCKVQVECSRCHKSLVRTSKLDIARLSGVVGSVQVDEQRNFWDTQLPLNGSLPKAPDTKNEHRHLKCPSHCPIGCGEVTWECSGLLDDGTGQCKLYSEREGALALLGIDSQSARSVEDGAWETETGICYQKAMPPSSFLKQSIHEARIEVARQAKGRKVKSQEILRMLTPAARASYLLHQHCTNSPNTKRNLDFFVRCKPLSTEAFHLNRTEVETTTSQLMPTDTVVYSLPPLKLNLVSMA